MSDPPGSPKPPLRPVAVTVFISEITVGEGDNGWAEPAQGVVIMGRLSLSLSLSGDTYVYIIYIIYIYYIYILYYI